MLTQEEFTKAVEELDVPGSVGYRAFPHYEGTITVWYKNGTQQVASINNAQHNLLITAWITPELFDLIEEYTQTPVEYRKQVKHYAYIIEPHDPETNSVPVLIKEANGQWIIDKGYLSERSDGRWIETSEDSDKFGFTDEEITESPLFLNHSIFTKLEVSSDEKTGEHDE